MKVCFLRNWTQNKQSMLENCLKKHWNGITWNMIGVIFFCSLKWFLLILMEVGHQWPGVTIPMPFHYALLWLPFWGQRAEEGNAQWRVWGGDLMSSGPELCLSGSSAIQVRTEWEAILQCLPCASLDLPVQENLFLSDAELGPSLAGKTTPVQYLSANKWEKGFDSCSYSISDINAITLHSTAWLWAVWKSSIADI